MNADSGYGGGEDKATANRAVPPRGMMERGSDEVRSWLGDDEAERRRQRDQQRDARGESHDMQRPREGGSRTPYCRDMGDGDESDVRESRERGGGRQSASPYRPTTFSPTRRSG